MNYKSLWLDYRPIDKKTCCLNVSEDNSVSVYGKSPLMSSVRRELKRAFSVMFGNRVPAMAVGSFSLLPPDLQSRIGQENLPGGNGYKLCQLDTICVITSSTDKGVLYGTFAFLRFLQTGNYSKFKDYSSAPNCVWRMLNLSAAFGTAAGESLETRYGDYARLCASVGLNACVICNDFVLDSLRSAVHLKQIAELAGIFRAWGISIFLSVPFASPVLQGALQSADSDLDEVRSFWKERVDEIYASVPDFGGFVVSADEPYSPSNYGRTDADCANVIAGALESHGGTVIWHVNAATCCDSFKALDGMFLRNVAVQVRISDLQEQQAVRRLFSMLQKTAVFIECPLSQEKGRQNGDSAYLVPQWKAVLDKETEVCGGRLSVGQRVTGAGHKNGSFFLTGMAGVAGAVCSCANWYAFGRLAWDISLSAEDISAELSKQSCFDSGF